ncbi:leucine-rich repeat neuronal protein 1-like [Malaclemys terrapin pileata]|uniref:leucine-rich repeat neuronal protein 1-like n=1 Tax=Malaclemys terrapin pileata TaxID=2991368 RepID=UPI0023A808A4|nr:leucine-rich repeat neuronal protein 1-like [Malaclemys terrapin pileata]
MVGRGQAVSAPPPSSWCRDSAGSRGSPSARCPRGAGSRSVSSAGRTPPLPPHARLWGAARRPGTRTLLRALLALLLQASLPLASCLPQCICATRPWFTPQSVYRQAGTVDCNDLLLTRLLPGLAPDTQVLLLQSNQIARLTGELRRLPNLTDLDLSQNRPASLPCTSTPTGCGLWTPAGSRPCPCPAWRSRPLGRLQSLGLAGLGLRDLPAEAFQGLAELESLSLFGNRLARVPAPALAQVPEREPHRGAAGGAAGRRGLAREAGGGARRLRHPELPGQRRAAPGDLLAGASRGEAGRPWSWSGWDRPMPGSTPAWRGTRRARPAPPGPRWASATVHVHSPHLSYTAQMPLDSRQVNLTHLQPATRYEICSSLVATEMPTPATVATPSAIATASSGAPASLATASFSTATAASLATGSFSTATTSSLATAASLATGSSLATAASSLATVSATAIPASSQATEDFSLQLPLLRRPQACSGPA